VLARWQAIGVTCVKYEFGDELQNLKAMLKSNHNFSHAEQMSYDSLQNYQMEKEDF